MEPFYVDDMEQVAQRFVTRKSFAERHWTDNVEYVTAGYWVYSPAGFDIVQYPSGWCVHTPNTYVEGFKTLEVAVKYCNKLYS